MFHKRNFFRVVFFMILGLAAAYLYFNFGPVHTGAPKEGSDDLMYLNRTLNWNETWSFDDETIRVMKYGILGYRDMPTDVSIFTLRYTVEYLATAEGLEEKTASVVPVVIRKYGDGVEWEEFEDATYAEQFKKLPGTIREILTNGEKHNAAVMMLDAEARLTAQKALNDWYTYENVDFGYQIDYPVGWKMWEYSTGFSHGKIIAAAFDPEKVANSEEYESLDSAPGTVWIYLSDAMPDGSFEKADVGGISAAYFKDECVEPTCPNPWWLNRVGENYYIQLPESVGDYKFLNVVVQYPKEKKYDLVLQESIKNMLASFKFIND